MKAVADARALAALGGAVASAPIGERYQVASDLLWEALRGVSWVGFYSKAATGDEMILVARRDKPACSPIGLHGICGLGWRERRGVVVRDVGVLGAHYIACDPRDRSEVVVPLLGADGTCSGVLDVDSHEAGAFDLEDAWALGGFLAAAGLSRPMEAARGVIVI